MKEESFNLHDLFQHLRWKIEDGGEKQQEKALLVAPLEGKQERRSKGEAKKKGQLKQKWP